MLLAAPLALADFDYDLPPALIAQAPPPVRDAARLLRVPRNGAPVSHHAISDLPRLLRPHDLLVFNDTRVIPARLFARKASGGEVEVLLTKPLSIEPSGGVFEAMIGGRKKVRGVDRLTVADDLHVALLSDLGGGFFKIRLEGDDVMGALHRHGHVPLPPYIDRADAEADRERYQTIFAKNQGSAAAPTAGLHFTPALLAALAERGVAHTTLTLHVGPGTFLPVREEAKDDIRRHVMHAEIYALPQACADAVAAAKARGGRVVAVGTTSARTLEAVAHARGAIVPARGETDIFITPGFAFKAVDALITNFHLPRSTLLMLVAAFSSLETVRGAYAAAIAEKYRFFSYGDACLFE